MPTLNDTHRRVIANLSIPRNVVDLAHVLTVDEHSPTLPPDEVRTTLEVLEQSGLVVNLGAHENPGRLAAAVEKSSALTMPDDKAQTYETRLSSPRHAWRLTGDQFMLTDAGLETLRDPGDQVPEAFTTAELRELVHKQAAQVQHDAKFEGSIFDEDGGVLHDDQQTLAKPGDFWLNPRSGLPVVLPQMLPEEFRHWLDTVLGEHERVWGQAEADEVRRGLPMKGGAGSYADATELLILDADRGGTAYSETSPTYLALSILAFTDADTGTTADDASHIPTYTGYARKSAALADFNAAAGGTRTTANALAFANCTAGSSTIVGMARCTAATAGRMIRYSTVASTTISTTQTPAQFAAGAITDSLD